MMPREKEEDLHVAPVMSGQKGEGMRQKRWSEMQLVLLLYFQTSFNR